MIMLVLLTDGAAKHSFPRSCFDVSLSMSSVAMESSEFCAVFLHPPPPIEYIDVTVKDYARFFSSLITHNYISFSLNRHDITTALNETSLNNFATICGRRQRLPERTSHKIIRP